MADEYDRDPSVQAQQDMSDNHATLVGTVMMVVLWTCPICDAGFGEEHKES